MPTEVHLRNVDGEYIKKFAKRMEADNASQDAIDQAYSDMDNLKNAVSIGSSKKDSNPKTLKMGIIGRQNKKNAGILHILPFARFNSPTTNDKDIKHANKLEAFIQGAVKKSQKTGDSQSTIPGKGVRTGRAWEMTIADPSVWTGDSFKEQAKKISDAPSGSRKEAEEKLKLMKRDQWPIQTTEVDSRKTWTYFSGKVWLPEVVQIRKMTLDAIQSEWPDFKTERVQGSRELPVHIYSNHFGIWTEIEGKIVHEFEHDMGMNPVQLGEFVRAPENDMNIRWLPDAYHVMEIAEAIDESLSDWRTAQREATRAQIVIKFDKDDYDIDAMEGGRPKSITIEPGGEMIPLWKDESIERVPGAVMNEQATFYTSLLIQMAESEIKRPSSEGNFKSGTSGNMGLIENQLAERDLDPMLTALRSLFEAKVKLILRAVVRVNRDFPSRPDKLAVYDPRVTGKTFIEIGPDDVIGQEWALTVLAEKAIPTDKNLTLAQAQREKDLGYDAEVYMGITGGAEDVPAIKQRRFRDDLEMAVNQVLIAETINRTIAIQQTLTNEEQAEVTELRSGASPEFLQGVQPTAQGQSNANIQRLGVPNENLGIGR